MQLSVVAALLVTLSGAGQAGGPLAEARRLYNEGQYEAAERMARTAAGAPALAQPARVVLGRVQLERFRQSADPQLLVSARETLSGIDTTALDPAEQVELTIGLGEAFFLENRFGAAAELFQGIRRRSILLGASAHERVLDWWATSLDRHAQTQPPDDRPGIYRRLLDQITEELSESPGSAAASYWMVAAARGAGDLDRAWQAAMASWARAVMTEDRGTALRADLDRVVTQAIIPERAGKLARTSAKSTEASLLGEWSAFKEAYGGK